MTSAEEMTVCAPGSRRPSSRVIERHGARQHLRHAGIDRAAPAAARRRAARAARPLPAPGGRCARADRAASPAGGRFRRPPCAARPPCRPAPRRTPAPAPARVRRPPRAWPRRRAATAHGGTRGWPRRRGATPWRRNGWRWPPTQAGRDRLRAALGRCIRLQASAALGWAAGRRQTSGDLPVSSNLSPGLSIFAANQTVLTGSTQAEDDNAPATRLPVARGSEPASGPDIRPHGRVRRRSLPMQRSIIAKLALAAACAFAAGAVYRADARQDPHRLRHLQDRARSPAAPASRRCPTTSCG